MNYIRFSEKFYQKNIPLLDRYGFQRTLESFHLVDMYPSLKAMEKFSNTKELIKFTKKFKHLNDQALIYIHFPFCKNLCNYCHLYKENICTNGNLESDYINSLIKEIEIYIKMFDKKITARSIYFGGGTPSLMSISSLRKILNALKDFFDIPDGSFISFEFYPDVNFDEHVMIEKLKLLKCFGVKEIVLDIQSTNPKSLREIGRGKTSFSSLKRMIKIIKKVGIDRIKTSLIIGLPFDNLRTFKKSIFNIINTKEISTVSLFLLEFRKGLRIFEELRNKKYKFCNSKERDKMQIMARKILHDKGFYESPLHFFNRKKHKANKYNKEAVIGTHKNHLLGFGPSAYGHIVIGDKSIKYHNRADIHFYMDKISKGDLPISRWYKLNKEAMVLSEIINDISFDGVIDKNEMRKKYSYDIEKKFKNILSGFEKLKLIKRHGDKIIITELGKLRIEEMIWYLYDEKYKLIQSKTSKDKDIAMHNYITILSRKNEMLFNEFIKTRQCK